MNIIISPLITEKSMMDAGNGKYTFRVHLLASKEDVKRAIEKKFKVHVTNISTSILKGRSTKVGARRTQKDLSNLKKAVVTLKQGEKIGMFELGGDEKKKK